MYKKLSFFAHGFFSFDFIVISPHVKAQFSSILALWLLHAYQTVKKPQTPDTSVNIPHNNDGHLTPEVYAFTQVRLEPLSNKENNNPF